MARAHVASHEVKVIKPDPVTGEPIVEVVSADHFKPKPPSVPKDRRRREHPCRRWDLLFAYDYLEPEADFWLAYADRLTRRETADLVAGRASSILRPVAPEWAKGDRIRIANNVEAEVDDVEWTCRGYRVVFRVADHRPWLMKQNMSGGSRPRTDAHGYPAALTPAEMEKARIDGAYTRTRSLAVPGTDEVMDDDLHDRLHGEQEVRLTRPPRPRPEPAANRKGFLTAATVLGRRCDKSRPEGTPSR